MLRGTTAFAVLLLALARAAAQVTPLTPVVNAGSSNLDLATGELVLTGNPSIQLGPTLLTADEIR